MKGGGVSLVMQPSRSHKLTYVSGQYPAMNESTTGIDIVPLPTGQDILTEVLRDGARRTLAQAIEAEAATWIETHAHLSSRWRGVGLRYLFSTSPGSGKQGHASESPLLGYRAASQTVVLTRHQATDRSQPPRPGGLLCMSFRLYTAGLTQSSARLGHGLDRRSSAPPGLNPPRPYSLAISLPRATVPPPMVSVDITQSQSVCVFY